MSEKEVGNGGVLSKMLPLQRYGKMPQLPRDGQAGAAEREKLYFLLSPRQREMPELPWAGGL